ncbi:hypothetical protein B0H17DRAFT_1200045 [Mycena rosella]|uniref:Uncharacterized protein n=1 Tax=Mycena rosella TaxID=1033263 RepID=A0AAD7DJM5_MYCRO|nr:hypothetical protein B0H17DRAFT_1200045 [Mycena rosella]
MFLLAALIVLASIIQTAAAATSFTMYALNGNGLVNSTKMAHINTAINSHNPHAFILSESKTNLKIGPDLPNNDYTIFEEPGVQAENHHLYKWDVVLGIRKAVDIVLQTNNGKDFFQSHRHLCPVDPGTPATSNFWPELTKLCQSTTLSWTVGGDLNATVSAAGQASGGAKACAQFLLFLDHAAGHDIWTNYPDRNRNYDWTSRANPESTSGNIINRVVTSKRSLLDSQILVADHLKDFNFRDDMDNLITAAGLEDKQVHDDTSFLDVYDSFTELLIPAAERAYRRINRYTRRPDKRIMTPKIEKIIAQIQFMGGTIRTICDNNAPDLTHGAQLPYLAKTQILPDTQVTTQQGVQTWDLMSYLAGIKCWAKRHKVEGMYDAVNAYGLPSAIIDLDHATQTDTKCFIRTAHAIIAPVIITSVTKQGSSLSPVKLTLTTSLGHHYLNNLMASDPDALIITSGSAQKADPHLPDDFLQAKTVMAEATEDSYIFSQTLASLRCSALAMERFSIVKQNIISKARTLLSLQPIKRADAEDLDTRIKVKIHMELGMPFMPSMDIFTLPIDLHGFDFPSITRINNRIAIDGLHRDLNHPIASYWKLARLILADWTCHINNCTNPIDSDGLTCDFTCHTNCVPYGWIVAQKAMTELSPKLALKRTHNNGILTGNVSLSHMLKTFGNHLPLALCPNGQDMGQWRMKADGAWLIDTKSRPMGSSWTLAAKTNWDKLSNVLRCSNIHWYSLGQPDVLQPRED